MINLIFRGYQWWFHADLSIHSDPFPDTGIVNDHPGRISDATMGIPRDQWPTKWDDQSIMWQIPFGSMRNSWCKMAYIMYKLPWLQWTGRLGSILRQSSRSTALAFCSFHPSIRTCCWALIKLTGKSLVVLQIQLAKNIQESEALFERFHAEMDKTWTPA